MKKIIVINENLINERMKKGFTCVALSKACNISNTSMNAIETGTMNPSPSTARKICDVLEVDFDKLFEIGGEG